VKVSVVVRWIFGLTIAFLVGVVPVVYYRWSYTHAKRLREVEPGILYRSGQLTVSGFEEAIPRLGIRTIVNLQDEYADPDIREGYFTRATEKESELCRRLGVRYVFMPPALLHPREVRAHRPPTIDAFLKLMDDPSNYPVLVHCRAGLHRTGVLVAVYRMEYDHWGPSEAIREMLENGFGRFACDEANDYITQYILTYKPRPR
jgi:protein tyrosine/serine phosphatase